MATTDIYCTDQAAKQQLVQIGKRIYDGQYVLNTDGNISIRVSPFEIWVTPTSVSKGYMTEDMMVKMNLDGEVIAGTHKPSSEVKMHLRLYQENPAIGAVVHAHPFAATSFAVAGIPLDLPLMAESSMQLGVVPVVHYATPGTNDVADGVAPYCQNYGGVLLSNHGTLTWGHNIMQAFYRLEVMENYAKTTLAVLQLGQARLLSQPQVEALAGLKKTWKIDDGVLPQGAAKETNTTDVLKSNLQIANNN
ncbi:class II aldolase/adducin family protein [Ruminococcaceae bacterium OttesenSCG-928-A16]|nr:class II aldolase/adducin family protein [Ruminococcaceae bacterium OttesenSCG-928-A16]